MCLEAGKEMTPVILSLIFNYTIGQETKMKAASGKLDFAEFEEKRHAELWDELFDADEVNKLDDNEGPNGPYGTEQMEAYIEDQIEKTIDREWSEIETG